MCPPHFEATGGSHHGDLQANRHLMLALMFAANKVEAWECQTFLQDFLAGKLEDWPEFREFIDELAQSKVEGRL